MDGRVQGAMLLAVGGVATRLGLTGAALAYVKPSQRPLLAIAGGVLLVLGAVTIRNALRPAEVPAAAGPRHHHVHDHTHAPAIAWLLVLVVLAVLLVAPPPLGAFAAGRQLGGAATPMRSIQDDYPPMPAPVDRAVPLSLLDFTVRARYDQKRSLDAQRVRLVGFVTPANGRGDYLLTRFLVSCCAADGTAVMVEIHGDRPRAADTWLTVEGVWRPEPAAGPDGLPILDADTVTEIPQPAVPYEY
jgi:uncharacterized repeat protein (TIGR03943 family)